MIIGERGDPRDRITNQLPLRLRSGQGKPTCEACGGTMSRESLNADGETWACPCGRTRLTVLSDRFAGGNS